MKRVLVMVAAVAASGSAMAADLGGAPYRGSLKDDPVVAGYNWSGIYIGGHGGWANADFDFNTKVTGTPSQEGEGGFGGVQGGINFQRSNFVFGIEADVSFGDLSDNVKDGNYITQSTEVDTFGSVRARLGYSFGRVLPYITGGLGWANATAGEKCPPGAEFGHCSRVGAYNLKDDATYFGWTIGAGIELAIAQGWSVKAEYLHFDLGEETFDFGPKASSRSPELEMDTVKFGLNYKFN